MHDSHSRLIQDTQALMARVRWHLLGSPPEVAISPTQVLSFGKGVSESHPYPRGKEFSPTSWGRKRLSLVLEVLLYGSIVPCLFIHFTYFYQKDVSEDRLMCVHFILSLSSHSQFPQALRSTQRCVRSVLLAPGRVKARLPVWPPLTTFSPPRFQGQ